MAKLTWNKKSNLLELEGTLFDELLFSASSAVKSTKIKKKQVTIEWIASFNSLFGHAYLNHTHLKSHHQFAALTDMFLQAKNQLDNSNSNKYNQKLQHS